MRLTNEQLRVLDIIHNDGFIWLVSGCPYLASVDKDGRVNSKRLGMKTFRSLIDRDVLCQDDRGHWVSKT